MSRKIELEDLLTFACKFESKKPATWHGHKDAKVQNIEDLTIKGYNVGLAMKLNNLICLDVDEKNGKTGLQDMTDVWLRVHLERFVCLLRKY